MGSFSIWHWLIVLIIIALVFGTKKIRNIGSDLGIAIKDFKAGMDEGEKSDVKVSSAEIKAVAPKPREIENTKT